MPVLRSKINPRSDAFAANAKRMALAMQHGKNPVPVTPAQMAAQARDAFSAGASIMHIHMRDQEDGFGHMPSSDPM